MRKKKFFSKKGFSMVMAIGLAAVLFLSAGTFLSVSMFQQNSNYKNVNSKQAYISAKSALDLTKELLENQESDMTGKSIKIDLPTNEGDTNYFVLYNDGTDSNVRVEPYFDAEAAKTAIKSSDSVVGNAYIKITNVKKVTDLKDEYTATAVGYAGEIDGTDPSLSASANDLSFKFIAEKTINPDKKETVTYEDKNWPTPVSDSTKYMMLNAQTNFTLQKYDGRNLQYRSLSQTNISDGELIAIPWLEGQDTPVNSYFPVVFTASTKINSNDDRCIYNAHNSGVYFLGKYSGSDLNDFKKDGEIGPSNVSYYTNNGVYGANVSSELLTINGNMLAKAGSSGLQFGLKVKRSSTENYTYNGRQGVVVHITDNTYFAKYDSDRNCTFKSKTFAPGYYWLDIADNTNGYDMFSNDMESHLTKIDFNTVDGKTIKERLSKIDLCNQSDGQSKDTIPLLSDTANMRSAFENEQVDGKTKIEYLGSDGKFTTYTGETGCYNSTSLRTDLDDASVYCGPSAAPTAGGSYNMRCGKSMNFLWYNISDLVVNNDVKLSVSSSNNVLSIGPDQGETLGDNKASNKVTAGGSSSEFNVCPYNNGETYSITVMCDFQVSYGGNTYTVKQGIYTDDLPAGGLNLFSDTAKDYFSKYSEDGETPEAPTTGTTKKTGQEMGWVDSSGVLTNATAPGSDANAIVDFKASSGTLYPGAYEAKAIYFEFSSSLTGLSSNFKAEKITLNMPSISGSSFIMQPTEGKAKNTSGDVAGYYLTVYQDCTVNPGEEGEFTINKGKYFFPLAKYYSVDLNLFDKSVFDNAKCYYCSDPNGKEGTLITKGSTSYKVTITEGSYY